jgi:hypothetical protein
MHGRDGIQMRMNSWQDGVTGTNCPIPPGWNLTYQFQLKDQIGSFFYFPSLGLQRAAGGYGPVTVNNRAVVPVPFDQPYGDVTLFIGDWYTKSHTVSLILSLCVCCRNLQFIYSKYFLIHVTMPFLIPGACTVFCRVDAYDCSRRT